MSDEKTGSRLSRLASRILRGSKPTEKEVKSMAASLLTQSADKEQRVELKDWEFYVKNNEIIVCGCVGDKPDIMYMSKVLRMDIPRGKLDTKDKKFWLRK